MFVLNGFKLAAVAGLGMSLAASDARADHRCGSGYGSVGYASGPRYGSYGGYGGYGGYVYSQPAVYSAPVVYRPVVRYYEPVYHGSYYRPHYGHVYSRPAYYPSHHRGFGFSYFRGGHGHRHGSIRVGW